MNSLDTLYYSLSLGFLILIGGMTYMIYHLTETIKSTKRVVDDTKSLTHDLADIKDGFKVGILGLITAFSKMKLLKGR
jgi:hypothetical protein